MTHISYQEMKNKIEKQQKKAMNLYTLILMRF